MRSSLLSNFNQKNPASRGFSLVELLVVVGILAILVVVVGPKVVGFYSAYQLDTLSQDLVQTIRLADMRAMQSEGSSPYSVHLVNGSGGSFTLYRGTNFASRDTNYDEVHSLPNSLSLTYSGAGPEINFTKLEGITANTGSITITWPDGNQSKTVTVNSYGVVDRSWQ
ncbi:MAG: type II secretion system protein [Candidatus Pacebacteria bacterium]|nr:type II secretion system protein [Candidatus Paceibacterota bacterium]